MSQLFVREGGVVRECAVDSFAHHVPGADFIWLHLNGASDDVDKLIAQITLLPDAALSALKAYETRPRCATFGGGALVNMRGLGASTEDDGDPLVSIRIWAQKGLAISLSFRPLSIFPQMTQQMMAGYFSDPGDLISATAMAITDELDPDIADLGDELDEFESRVLEEGQRGVRHRVAELRAIAISYRRFLAPQRQAMERLMALQEDWLEPDDRIHLQEAADRCARMVEELEAVRERAALVHEALTDLRAEHMNRQALILAIVALIFLPLTFVTGLLGMNVDGIPFAHHPWAFWGVVAFCLIMGAGVAIWFKMTHWLRK
ncbi:MAG: zinc transporter ZntB [Sphingobium sp.]|nr:zinc transporter ZntB [Sphingobium sp.]